MPTKTKKEALHQNTINGLRGEMRHIGKLENGTHLFETYPAAGVKPYVMWFVCDNGGEFNIGPVNHPEEMRSIPYTAHTRTLSPRTMAYRLGQVVKGADIDWTLEYPEA